MANEVENLRVLSMLDKGQITAGEAASLLEALNEAAGEEWEDHQPRLADLDEGPGYERAEVIEEEPQAQADAEIPVEESPGQETSAQESETGPGIPPDLAKWRRFWLIPFGIGLVTLLLGATWMYNSYTASGIGFWFVCAWAPFLFGVAVLALGWHSRTARWLHVRVRQAQDEWPRNIAISFPLPLRLTAWMAQRFGDRIPEMSRAGIKPEFLDELVIGLEKYATPETPLYVEVDEADGDKVLVYIG